jgi:predicted alpha/beta superfamily hydrolase
VRAFPCFVIVLLLAACGGAGGGGTTAAPPAPPAQAGTRTTSAIYSTETGIAYTYQVFVPAGYAQGTARYPVIYAADGEYRFPVLSGILERRGSQAILVNVWHMGADRRWEQFTMTGAVAYYRFLTRELIPAIDAQYRTDPSWRAYTGHSLSGLFAVYAFYLEAPGERYFKAVMSGDASLWARPDRNFDTLANATSALTLEQQMFERDRNLSATLVLAGQNSSSRVLELYEHLRQRGYPNLRLSYRGYTQGHLEMDGPSFEDALPLLLGP